jgi:hypothetical protein
VRKLIIATRDLGFVFDAIGVGFIADLLSSISIAIQLVA